MIPLNISINDFFLSASVVDIVLYYLHHDVPEWPVYVFNESVIIISSGRYTSHERERVI